MVTMHINQALDFLNEFKNRIPLCEKRESYCKRIDAYIRVLNNIENPLYKEKIASAIYYMNFYFFNEEYNPNNIVFFELFSAMDYLYKSADGRKFELKIGRNHVPQYWYLKDIQNIYPFRKNRGLEIDDMVREKNTLTLKGL